MAPCCLCLDANDLMKPLHHRRPVILSPMDYAVRLDSEELPDTLKGLLRPFNPEDMEAYPISTFVNSPRNHIERCIEPL
ncbi:MAG: SOS response-associated peptidase family protein [Gemmataceae bacterium]